MPTIQEWTHDGEPFLPLDFTRAGAIDSLERFYSRDMGNHVLREVLQQAFRLQTRSVVIEYRYVDSDYRNEHSEFYSKTFRGYPAFAHRLHFFKDKIDFTRAKPGPSAFESSEYLGYSVMRPIPAAPVGRTVLPSPFIEDMRTVLCTASDGVNLFGSQLTARGMPFYAQDAQLSRCGQASIMTVSYYHHIRLHGERHMPGDLARSVAFQGSELGRRLPSPGLNVAQIVDASSSVGLPPVTYEVAGRASIDTEALICRYLNSRLPVVVATATHAFTLVGYQRTVDADGRSSIKFLRHDDEVGPYQWVENWHYDDLEDYGPWKHVLAPLPPKVYLTGDLAEPAGHVAICDALKRSGTKADETLLERIKLEPSPITLRTAVMRSNVLKKLVNHADLPQDVVTHYQFTPMSRYVWLIEATDRGKFFAGEPPVLAEAIIDATDHARDPRPLAWRVPGGVGRYWPDHNRRSFEPVESFTASKSLIGLLGHVNGAWKDDLVSD